MSRATTPNVPALQRLREELDPDLQRMYPEMLTAVAPPTRDDILDVMIKLQAVTLSVRYVAEIAMEIITSLVIGLVALWPFLLRPRTSAATSNSA